MEQQLESLNEKTLRSGEQTCRTFLAPQCSTEILNINSSCGNERGAEPDEKVCSDKLSVPSEDSKDDSESSDRLLPCPDEEGENIVLETQVVGDSPKAKRKGCANR